MRRAVVVALGLGLCACAAVTGLGDYTIDDVGGSTSGGVVEAKDASSAPPPATPVATPDGSAPDDGSSNDGVSDDGSGDSATEASTPKTYAIGGTVSGLTAGTVVLQNNGGDNLSIAANGGGVIPFTFATRVQSGSAYSVTRLTNPSGLSCVVSAASGPVTNADIASVVVSCGPPGSRVFSATGAAQTFTVPAWVTEVTLEVWGAQGNRNAKGVQGGLGGYATGKLAVTPGQVLNVFVGGGDAVSSAPGFNGGGVGGPGAETAGGGGGGASDVRASGVGLAHRVIVAGGGGGAAGNRVQGGGRGSGGGGGGGLYGGGGGAAWPQNSTTLPKGGTQSVGGAGGTSTFATAPSNAGTAGALGLGGAGGAELAGGQSGSATASVGGAGGGATGSDGVYGATYTGQSGAGGSGYIGGVTNASMSSGTRAGAGQATISY